MGRNFHRGSLVDLLKKDPWSMINLCYICDVPCIKSSLESGINNVKTMWGPCWWWWCDRPEACNNRSGSYSPSDDPFIPIFPICSTILFDCKCSGTFSYLLSIFIGVIILSVLDIFFNIWKTKSYFILLLNELDVGFNQVSSVESTVAEID